MAIDPAGRRLGIVNGDMVNLITFDRFVLDAE